LIIRGAQKSNPENIKAGLNRLGELLAKSTVKTITMPSLGCGLGGMDFIGEFAPMAISICNKYANKDGRKIYTYLFAPQELRSTEEAALEVQLRQIGARLK
jgi:O-acetyl-ADP-ribose deacetylase (regulator of RNase III)